MTLKAESKYPSRRTYVLKVRSDANSGALAGRLENLVTGQQQEFASGDELIEWIVCDLDVLGEGPDDKDRLPVTTPG